MKTIFLTLTLLISFQALAIDKDSMLPPINKKFRVRVDFWKKVYTEITSSEAFIHDKVNIGVIYKKVDLKSRNYKTRARNAKKEVRKIKNTLLSIAKKKLVNLTYDEKRILKLSQAKTVNDIYKAIKNLRSQYGLKDNYYIGLKRSHRYLGYIKKVFKEYGLPKELIFLPHVESSFNYRAYSKVGAAGIWQFMRSTGRLYNLKLTYAIDERRDPFKATVAAARLLSFNYKKIQNWPLAITAYNHGLRSMQRALKKVGSGEISDIIDKYKGRRFGFASKNFYATFIATVEISQDPKKYFPSFEKPRPFEYSFLSLPKPLTVNQIKKALKLDLKTIKMYNPSIRSIAYRASLQLPKNFQFQLPILTANKKEIYLGKLKSLKSLTSDMRVAAVHKIRRGETLYTLSKIYRVSLHNIIVFNQISNPSRVYPGMKVKIPGSKEIALLNSKAKTNASDVKIVKEPVIAKADANQVNKVAINKEDYNDELAKTDPTQIAKVHKKMSWFDKLFSDDDDGEVEINKIEAEEAKAEDKKSDIASTLVSLKNYNLTVKNLSQDLYEIFIETDETLGHYADWAIIRINSIRKANRMNRNSTIRIGQKLKLRLTPKQFNDFMAKRAEYHLSIQEDFYQTFNVNGAKDYIIESGDNLSTILNKFEIPLWLVRQYQAENFNINNALRVGDKIKIPIVEQRTN